MKKTLINLGPQHPAVHGVLRLIIELNNENIVKINNEIGYLHRGSEKLFEYSEYYKITPFFDRFDYTGLMLCEHAYILSLEKIINLNTTYSVQIYRTLLNEIMRVSSHFLALTTSAMDIGAITPFLWVFEEREEIANLFENISGARMHTSILKVGSLNHNPSYNDLLSILELTVRLKVKIQELYELLNNSTIWKTRFQNVGIIEKSVACSYSLTGPIIRSLGYTYDQRLQKPYESFFFKPINIIYGYLGDNFTRFFLRLEEIKISLQYMEILTSLLFTNNNTAPKLITNFTNLETMEEVIKNFKKTSEGGYSLSSNKSYVNVESPKGEFGVSLISNNKLPNRPYRLKIRSPGFYNLSSLNIVCTNYILSDCLSYLSTLDLILGEVDK